jgi:hypothetical protein
MSIEEAMEFLKNHQPMPSDEDLTQEIIDKYDEVRKLFLANRVPECVPLFLNSFGDWDGFGVYQMIEDVIKKFEYSEVVPHIQKALKSQHRSVRYWNSQISAIFPSEELIKPLGDLLKDDDCDVKYASLTALSQIHNDFVRNLVRAFQKSETDFELLELAEEISTGYK